MLDSKEIEMGSWGSVIDTSNLAAYCHEQSDILENMTHGGYKTRYERVAKHKPAKIT